MFTKTMIDNTTYAAQLTGPELEILSKILGKMARVDQQYVGGKYVNIPGDRLDFKIEIGGEVESITREEYDLRIKEQNRLERAGLVKYINSTEGDIHKQHLSNLKSNLYYNDFWTYNQRDEVNYEPQSKEHGVVDFILADVLVRVNDDGTVDKFPHLT